MRTSHRGLALGAVLLLGSVALAATPYVYPKKGQSAEQQNKDSYECDKWARAQSGVDPGAPPPTGQYRVQGTMHGAARGAAMGAAVGAIGGNAGKGAAAGSVVGAARGRQRAMYAEQQAAAGARDSFARAFAACMDARGYSVR